MHRNNEEALIRVLLPESCVKLDKLAIEEGQQALHVHIVPNVADVLGLDHTNQVQVHRCVVVKAATCCIAKLLHRSLVLLNVGELEIAGSLDQVFHHCRVLDKLGQQIWFSDVLQIVA